MGKTESEEGPERDLKRHIIHAGVMSPDLEQGEH